MKFSLPIYAMCEIIFVILLLIYIYSKRIFFYKNRLYRKLLRLGIILFIIVLFIQNDYRRQDVKWVYLLIAFILIIFLLIFYINYLLYKKANKKIESFNDYIKIDETNNNTIDFITNYNNCKNDKKKNLQEDINKIEMDRESIIKPPYIFVNNIESFANNDPKNSLYSPSVDCDSTLDCKSVISIENKLLN